MFAKLFSALISITVHGTELPKLGHLKTKQVHCVAEAIYHESRGEPKLGQAAVAMVIFNRSTISEFPESWCEVVYQPGQFQWVKKTKRGHKHNNPTWNNSYAAAVEFSVMYTMGISFVPESVGSATFFSRGGFNNPKLTFSDQIGDHKFFQIIN